VRTASIARSLLVLLIAVIPLTTNHTDGSPVGRLYGKVLDRDGRPIAGAVLRVTGSGAVGVYDARTDERGTYQFMALPTLETLEIRAESPGRLPVVYKGITVRESSGTRRDFKLRGVDEHEVLILYDPRVKYHEAALQGARSTIKADIHTLKVSGRGVSEFRRLSAMLAKRPNAVLAIGPEPARLSRRAIKDVPVVYTMVPDPVGDDLSTANLCGLMLNGGYDDQLTTLASMRPNARRLVTIYDPRVLARSVGELARAARARGMSLQAKPARDLRQLTAALDKLDGRDFDAFFYLVDPALFRAGDFARVKRFSANGRLVLIVPDDSLVAEGGTFSHAPGFRHMGGYAGRLVNDILSGESEPAGIQSRFPTMRAFSVNTLEAGRLGLVIPQELSATAYSSGE
jgi:putative ABC transport system substrate-binding protein